MFGKLSQSWSFLSLGVFSPRNHLLHLAVIDLKNHSECGNKETYCKTCTWKKLFSSVSRMVLSSLNLMENNTVRYQRELNWTQSMTHSQTSSAKCVKILWRNIILNINLRKLGIFDSFPWLQTYLLIQMKTKDFKRRSTTVTSLHVKNSTSFSRREDDKPSLLQNMKNPLCWEIMKTSVTCVQKYRLRVDRGLRIRLQWFC